MATRISPDLENTEAILKAFLPLVLSGERVSFLVDPGQSFHVMARIRTMISRKRKALRSKNNKPRLFTLIHTVHKETHEGMRKECIVLWIEFRDSHMLGEMLDDLLIKELA